VTVMSDDDVPTRIASESPRSGAAGESRLDDWLSDEGTMEWFPGDDEAAAGGADRRARRRSGAAGGVLTPEEEAAQLYRRRRIAGLAAVAAVVVIVIVLAVTLSGGGSPKAPPTTPATTTPAVTTTPAAPKTTGKASTGHKPAALHLTLPSSGALKPGDTGSAVKTLQQALTRLGFSAGKADGTYGPLTKTAVVAFQQANGLTTDGIVGAQTAAKLNAALAAKSSA
jgi:Putative peptidoglycan binding domain